MSNNKKSLHTNSSAENVEQHLQELEKPIMSCYIIVKSSLLALMSWHGLSMKNA